MAAESDNATETTTENEIGIDRWVEQSDSRRQQHQGWAAPARRLFDNLNPGWKLLIFLVAATAYPLLVAASDVRVGITVLLLAMAVPLYARLAGRFERRKLISIVTLFFMACLIAFYFLVLAIVSLFVLLVALLTVSFHTYRAASANPVDCLRYE